MMNKNWQDFGDDSDSFMESGVWIMTAAYTAKVLWPIVGFIS